MKSKTWLRLRSDQGGGFFFGDFREIFGVLWAIFALLVAAAGEHTGFSLFFRPRGLLGAAGTKIVRPWLLGGRFCSSLWPSLGQVACTGQPPHRRGRVSPDKRIPPLPWRWSHPTPTPPTRVGWVPGWWCREVDHPVGFFFFCLPPAPIPHIYITIPPAGFYDNGVPG